MNTSSILLLKVAETYCAATGRSLEWLSETISQTRTRNIFTRLALGKGCSTATLDKALRWLDQNWPDSATWPPDVLRGPPLKKPDVEIVTSW